MAFEKTVTLNNGVSGNYIKITLSRVDYHAKKAHVILSVFLDAAHKNSPPILAGYLSAQFSMTNAELNGDQRATLYSKLAALNDPKLDSATNV